MLKRFAIKLFQMDSIRSRYAVGVILMSLLFVSSIWLSHKFTAGVISNSASNSVERSEFAGAHRDVRHHILQVEYALQSYLVSADVNDSQHVLDELDKALARISQIEETAWIKHEDLDDRLDDLTEELQQLRQHVVQLIRIRNDISKLFPAFVPINQVMLPLNNQFNTQMNLVIDDMSERLAEPHIRNAYHKFIKIKDTWNDMVGVFRTYVGSRALSLNQQSGKSSEYDVVIETHYKKLTQQIETMNALLAREDLGAQAVIAMREIPEIQKKWYQAYHKARKVQSTNEWRTDESLVQNVIHPINGRIWSIIDEIELTISNSSQGDVEKLAGAASDVNMMLWLRMLLIMVFLGIAFLAFEYWILRPVSHIARALKLEAQGDEVTILPHANTREARELIEAFDHMRDQVHMRQMELEHQAMHDTLTGLPNRMLLRRSLIRELNRAEREKSGFALLMIDLNKFKEINDTLGHHMGDRVLREIAPRFNAELTQKDVLARLGGDEFAVLLHAADFDRANDVAMRLSRSLEMDFNMDGQRLRVGSSIGIALYPKHGMNEQDLLQRADVAMYLAKHKGIGYVFYNEDQEAHGIWQLSFRKELQKAIDANQLELHYQPKIDFKTGKSVAVEALLRWNHPSHGLVPTEEVNLLAEKTGLIRPLTQWVLATAIRQLAGFMSRNVDLVVSVNLSVWNLKDPNFYDYVKTLLRESNVSASKLCFEVTEDAIMSDPDHASKTLNKLAELGAKLAIDDFGKGFSSVQYLKKLPISELKIDKSFVQHLIVDDNDAVIVRSIITLAHNLGLRAVAEGVESQEVYDQLQSLQCDEVQGYHIAHAMPAASLDSWLQESRWGLPRLKIVR